MSMKYQSEYDAQFEQWRDEFFERYPDRKAEYDEKFASAGSAEWLDYNKSFVSEVFGEVNAERQQTCSNAMLVKDEAQAVFDSKNKEIEDLIGTTDWLGNYGENTISWYDKQLNDAGSNIDSQTKTRLESERGKLLTQKAGFESEADELGHDVGRKDGLYSIRRAESVYAEACCYGNENDIDAAYEEMANAYMSYSSRYIDEDHMSYLMDGHVNSADDTKFLEENNEIFNKAEHFREVMGKETAAARYDKSKVRVVEVQPTAVANDKTETVSMSYDAQESESVKTVEVPTESKELTVDEKKAFVERFDETSAQAKANINSFAAQKQYESDSKTADAYREELGLGNKTSGKSNPYAFDRPVRTAEMSDEAYADACSIAEREHIDKVNNEIADAVIRGEYGCGTQRIEQLTAAGYDYSQVQSLVNDKMASYAQHKETQPVMPDVSQSVSEPETKLEPEIINSESVEFTAKKPRVLEETNVVEADDTLTRKAAAKSVSPKDFTDSLARIDDHNFGESLATINDNDFSDTVARDPIKVDTMSMANPSRSEKFAESLTSVDDKGFGDTLVTVEGKPKSKNLATRFDSICNDDSIKANNTDKSLPPFQKNDGGYDDA